MLAILAIFYLINFVNVSMQAKEIKYGDFYRLLKENSLCKTLSTLPK